MIDTLTGRVAYAELIGAPAGMTDLTIAVEDTNNTVILTPTTTGVVESSPHAYIGAIPVSMGPGTYVVVWHSDTYPDVSVTEIMRVSAPVETLGVGARPTPNLGGFREAMASKRDMLGEIVTLLGPVEATYDPSVKIDPDTGQPYDPMATPTASGRASASVQAGVAYRHTPSFAGAASDQAAGGLFDSAGLLVILASGMASAATSIRADTVLARGEYYKITAQRFDGVSAIDRFLIFCAQEGKPGVLP